MKHLRGTAFNRDRLFENGARPLVIAAILVVVALLSATVFAGIFSSTETYSDSFTKLDNKRNTVLTLTAASATASAALTLIPDDTCTPIAEQLSQISRDFTFVIAALLLEKYLLTIIGFLFFGIVLPLCCLAFAATQFMDRESPTRRMITSATIRLLVFGLIIFMATPASIYVTDRIDSTYKDSIDETVLNAQQLAEAVGALTASESAEQEPAQNPIEFLQQQLEGLQDFAGRAVTSATGALDWVRQLLGGFVEAFAVMLVTSIIIPILVPLVIYLAFKILVDQQPIIIQQDTAPALPPEEKRGEIRASGTSHRS